MFVVETLDRYVDGSLSMRRVVDIRRTYVDKDILVRILVEALMEFCWSHFVHDRRDQIYVFQGREIDEKRSRERRGERSKRDHPELAFKHSACACEDMVHTNNVIMAYRQSPPRH